MLNKKHLSFEKILQIILLYRIYKNSPLKVHGINGCRLLIVSANQNGVPLSGKNATAIRKVVNRQKKSNGIKNKFYPIAFSGFFSKSMFHDNP